MATEIFDEIIERRGTGSIKYQMQARGVAEDVFPLWVADMDFRTPDCVTRALEAQVRHGIFGYSEAEEDYFAVLQNWFAGRHHWDIKAEWLVKTPGVVPAIHIAVEALTKPGDAVLIQQPVYYPFAGAVASTGRTLVVNELCLACGAYQIDFQDFEEKIRKNQVKLFVLCNPQNPVGRVWTEEELRKMGDICVRHGVLVVSDEIHQDFVYPGHRHQVFAALAQEYSDITITCTAPSKTFNIAGLQISNIFIPNETLRRAFVRRYAACGLSQVGIMGIVACRAAYDGGEAWLEALRVYLQRNLKLLDVFLKERVPGVRLIEPEGTYLAWLDCRGLGMDAEALDAFMLQKAKLWLDGGTMFGAGGAGFQRINVALPGVQLERALERLEEAVKHQ